MIPRAPVSEILTQVKKEALGGGLAVEAPRVPGACRRAKHARYPEETRAEALRLLGLGKPTREIARALGLPSGSVVSRWAAEARRRAKMAPEAIAMGKEKGAPGPREAELDRLRMECAVLREMLSDPKAGDPARLSNRQKAELGERLSWKSALAAAGASRSMSRKGTCPDNARAEGFFGTLKQEFLYGREWAGVGREEFEGLLSGYMGWYVGRRPRRFREGGRARYETLAEHRRRLGYPVPPFAAQQAQ